MATVWLTYAWGDNENRDVEFVAQELASVGVDVKLDRWNLQAGKRLWAQIEAFVQDPTRSDAWAMYATQRSLGSEACKEEFAYALDRALHTRGESFPIMGLFPGPVEDSLVPAGIRTRLYVSLTDPDWKSLNPSIMPGPRGIPTSSGMMVNDGELLSDDREWWVMHAENACTPTQSYYVSCRSLPSRLAFGVFNGPPQYQEAFTHEAHPPGPIG
jgi:hypothetical protein